MNPRVEEHWKEITGSLGRNGATPVPQDLAARAFTRAISTVQENQTSFLDTLAPYALKGALVALILVIVVFSASVARRQPPQTTEQTNPIQLTWEIQETSWSMAVAAYFFPTLPELKSETWER